MGRIMTAMLRSVLLIGFLGAAMAAPTWTSRLHQLTTSKMAQLTKLSTTTTMCGSNSNVNDFSSRTAMTNAGWSFGWDDSYDFKPSPSTFCSSVPSTSWCGFRYPGVATLSLTFPSSGSVTVDFGNSWHVGTTLMKLNGNLIATASTGVRSTTHSFSFNANDVLSFTETSDTVMDVNSLSFTCSTVSPTRSPTRAPTAPPTYTPTHSPTEHPTTRPPSPSHTPTETPTHNPTPTPTDSPTHTPTTPTPTPTATPSFAPSPSPTPAPTEEVTNCHCDGCHSHYERNEHVEKSPQLCDAWCIDDKLCEFSLYDTATRKCFKYDKCVAAQSYHQNGTSCSSSSADKITYSNQGHSQYT